MYSIRLAPQILLICNFLFTFQASAQELSLPQAYERLENYPVDMNRDRNLTLRPLRDFFASRPEASAEFLLSKLQELNSEERKTFPDPVDMRKVMDSIIETNESGKNGFLRYDLANILGDIYPKLSPALRQQVLEVVADSFTPTTWERTGSSALVYALQRIGTDAVPYLLRLAGHDTEIVRCRAVSALMTIHGQNQPSPRIDCEGPTRIGEVDEWQRWWSKNQGSAVFPAVPSLFEEIERPATKRKR